MIDALKGAAKSKTVWFNAVLVPVFATLEAQFHLVGGLFGDKADPFLFLVIVINIVLRAVTNSSLSDKGKDDAVS